MRETKFRAWDGISMWNSDTDFVVSFNGKACYLLADEKHYEEAVFKNIMQYTGLKDKNGNEIYGGDIVIVSAKYPVRYIIGWDTKLARWCFVYNSGEPFKTIRESQINILEIIGNIYENPELLK